MRLMLVLKTIFLFILYTAELARIKLALGAKYNLLDAFCRKFEITFFFKEVAYI